MNVYRINVFMVLVGALIGGGWLVGLSLPHRAQPAAGRALEASKRTALTPLRFSTYLGGQASDAGSTIAIDDHGYIYVAGQTRSDDFPTRNSVMPYQGGAQVGTDVFVARLRAGRRLAALRDLPRRHGR